MVVITIILWSVLLLNLIDIPDHKIENAHLLIKKMIFWVKYDIDIKNVIKVYKTRFPDELLTSGRKLSFSQYVQVEFKDNQNIWKSTYVSPLDLDVFIKQIQLIQQDSNIISYTPISRKSIKIHLIIGFIICMLIAVLFDSYFTSSYRFIIGGPFGITILEVAIYLYFSRRFTKKICKNYYDNLEKYVIRGINV